MLSLNQDMAQNCPNDLNPMNSSCFQIVIQLYDS